MDRDWSSDEMFWDALDEFVEASWLPLKHLLDILHEYRDDMELPTQALLFGGIGNFVRVYSQMRTDTNAPDVSFNEALGAAQRDRRVQALYASGAEHMIDSKVDKMQEMN